jgi:3-oxoacyl-[acyl-carrier protein] reductase
MFNLTGMKALVTGASGGIGGAIAAALATQGAQVALSGTRMDVLESVASALPNDPKIIQCNLADRDEVETLVPQALNLLGSLDILVNNAGITRDGLAMRMKDEHWQAVLQVNLESSFRLCRAALKPMIKAKFGRIINITSVVGVTGNPGQVNYAAAKAGLIGMSKALAAEIATRQITVNCVAPGFIASPMTEALTDEQKSALSDKIPMARLGVCTEVAAGVAYLASREASYMTGQTLHINGGLVMI